MGPQETIAAMQLLLALTPNLFLMVCAELVSALIDQCKVTMTDARAFLL